MQPAPELKIAKQIHTLTLSLGSTKESGRSDKYLFGMKPVIPLSNRTFTPTG